MSYYFSRRIKASFDEALRRITDALKKEEFGIVTEIDVRDMLKKKLGVDFRPYRILGICNPRAAYEALRAEDKIGTMMPCGVIVQELGPEDSEIAAADPVPTMQAVGNPALAGLARDIQERIKRAVESA